MIKKSNPGKHSLNNRESKEGAVLRLIREARKLSLKDVGTKLNLKASEVDHIENGRRFYTEEDIIKFLACYKVSPDNFKILLEFKILNKQSVNHFLIRHL
jgi:transcriptional regulator with XRE-family HTH domain